MSHFNSQIQSQILEYELEGHVLAKMMLTTGVFAFMTSLLTIYMILKKSSVQMAQYKYYLLNITVWFFLKREKIIKRENLKKFLNLQNKKKTQFFDF